MRIKINNDVIPHEVRCGDIIRPVSPGMEIDIKDEHFGVFKDISEEIKEEGEADGE